MCPPLGNPQLYKSGAACPAGQSGTPINSYRKAACLKNTIYICAFACHSFMHDIMYRPVEHLPLRYCEVSHRLKRMDAGAKQAFIRIDITDTSHKRLIQ